MALSDGIAASHCCCLSSCCTNGCLDSCCCCCWCCCRRPCMSHCSLLGAACCPLPFSCRHRTSHCGTGTCFKGGCLPCPIGLSNGRRTATAHSRPPGCACRLVSCCCCCCAGASMPGASGLSEYMAFSGPDASCCAGPGPVTPCCVGCSLLGCVCCTRATLSRPTWSRTNTRTQPLASGTCLWPEPS